MISPRLIPDPGGGFGHNVTPDFDHAGGHFLPLLLDFGGVGEEPGPSQSRTPPPARGDYLLDSPNNNLNS